MYLSDEPLTEDFRVSSRLLSFALIAAAALTAFPVVVVFVQTQEIHRWMPVVANAAMLTVAFAILLLQISDWTAALAATWLTAAMTLIWATSTGIGLFANGTNRLVIGLELTQALANHQLAVWSLLQLTAYATLTFALGRCAARWRRAVEG